MAAMIMIVVLQKKKSKSAQFRYLSERRSEIAAWLGHAVSEGLVDDAGAGPDGARVFRLRARGRRLFSARRRRLRH